MQAEVVRVLLGEASRTDPVTQYYIMGRSYYAEAQVEFDEANTLARATGVGVRQRARGAHARVGGAGGEEGQQGAPARLRRARRPESLGLPGADGRPAPLIDVLHRLLWLSEHESRKIQDFLNQASPEKYLLRLTAQALSGPGAGRRADAGHGARRAHGRAARDRYAAGGVAPRVVDEGAML
ncbi:MAG: hypothetical protein HND48_03955 [Chloroflexi bacterium]|nr:hypothetical protein [Chloroflexota bacterium]